MQKDRSDISIGILDIYGFEIFQVDLCFVILSRNNFNLAHFDIFLISEI